jgi:hypothetical protein
MHLAVNIIQLSLDCEYPWPGWCRKFQQVANISHTLSNIVEHLATLFVILADQDNRGALAVHAELSEVAQPFQQVLFRNFPDELDLDLLFQDIKRHIVLDGREEVFTQVQSEWNWFATSIKSNEFQVTC